MARAGVVTFIAAAFAALSVQAAPAPNAAAVIAAASKAMGADGLNSISFYGSGANFGLGQSNHANGPWPRTNLNDYTRSIDFTAPATRATAVTWIGTVQGGAPMKGAYNQFVGPANAAWAQQLEIWTTPWGFLKGAAQNHATVAAGTLNGRPARVVTWMTPQKSPGGLAYKVVGYIGAKNLVERVDTWVENPVYGDLRVERLYTDYREANGVEFPSTIVEKRDGQSSFEAQILGIEVNPADIKKLVAAPAGPPGGPPPAFQGPASEKLADGVYRLNGAYNAMAVEFADYVLIFEPGPQSEARAQAIIAETKRLIPGKPIRYGVISHHHFDHTSGLEAAVAEGITIVTTPEDKVFFDRVLSGPRTLAPDAMAKSGKKAKIEAIVGDKRVFQDATRTFEIHRMKGLPHADGLVFGYLPKEKLVVYADVFNFPTPAQPIPDPPVVGSIVFLDNLERLKIEADRLLSVHQMAPDRLATMKDIRDSLGRKKPN